MDHQQPIVALAFPLTAMTQKAQFAYGSSRHAGPSVDCSWLPTAPPAKTSTPPHPSLLPGKRRVHIYARAHYQDLFLLVYFDHYLQFVGLYLYAWLRHTRINLIYGTAPDQLNIIRHLTNLRRYSVKRFRGCLVPSLGLHATDAARHRKSDAVWFVRRVSLATGSFALAFSPQVRRAFSSP
jgi:hypothetical protein